MVSPTHAYADGAHYALQLQFSDPITAVTSNKAALVMVQRVPQFQTLTFEGKGHFVTDPVGTVIGSGQSFCFAL